MVDVCLSPSAVSSTRLASNRRRAGVSGAGPVIGWPACYELKDWPVSYYGEDTKSEREEQGERNNLLANQLID